MFLSSFLKFKNHFLYNNIIFLKHHFLNINPIFFYYIYFFHPNFKYIKIILMEYIVFNYSVQQNQSKYINSKVNKLKKKNNNNNNNNNKIKNKKK